MSNDVRCMFATFEDEYCGRIDLLCPGATHQNSHSSRTTHATIRWVTLELRCTSNSYIASILGMQKSVWLIVARVGHTI